MGRVTPEITTILKNPHTGSDFETVLVEEPVYTHTAVDVYSTNGGSNFNLVQIGFNPETGESKVLETFSISRPIGLQFETKKRALISLKKVKKGDK